MMNSIIVYGAIIVYGFKTSQNDIKIFDDFEISKLRLSNRVTTKPYKYDVYHFGMV